MVNTNDNRMSWVRSNEEISKGNKYHISDFEIASEQYITGIFTYQDDYLICGLYVMDKDSNGLYKYLLRVKFLEGYNHNKEADEKGYYFIDGEIGELLCLFSLHLRCRFYVVSEVRGELNYKQLRRKYENFFLYRKTNPLIHPQIFDFERKNWVRNNTPTFLDLVKKLNPIYHQKFALACHLYHLALKQVGIDHEIVFIHLVSAIEALSEFTSLNQKDDILSGKNIDNMVDSSNFSDKEKLELKNLFNVRKSKKRFIKFVQDHNSGYFKGGNFKAKHCKIKKTDLPNILDTIYIARSEYLHRGEPMYLSRPMHGGEKWDTDPSVGKIVDNRTIPDSKKLPYTYFFEGLVRQCLINFLKKNQIK